MIADLSPAEIEEVLHQQIVGRLACHDKGVTYIVPVSYAYDGQNLYMHTREGLKIDMMRNNPQVCFETDIMRDMANWKSVIAWGVFEELTDTDERHAALQHLMNRTLPVVSSETTHLSPHWPFSPENLNEIKGIVYRIRLHKKTGRFEQNSSAGPVFKA